MSRRRLYWLSLTCALCALGLACVLGARTAPAAPRRQARALPPAPAQRPTPEPSTSPTEARFDHLPALRIENQASGESRNVTLYDSEGRVVDSAARELDLLLCDARAPGQHETTQMNRRTLQLVYKAAYHFRAERVQIVSAYRKPGRRREGPHGTGDAIDFRLIGVPARELAAYLRQLPRTGVGIYVHPKTQYVHLDSREHSYHWIDASPPGRHWREKSIVTPGLAKRDAAFQPSQDWP